MQKPGQPERIQKVLARFGFGSRREIENWIEAGRISVNGHKANLGDKISIGDKIRLDGELLHFKPEKKISTRILLYHKPAGEVSTRKDEKGRKTVFDSLPGLKNGRWLNIGRLDISTSGLLMLTNDGELVHFLTHPSNEFEREYAVRVLGEVSKEALTRLQSGVQLEDGMAKFDSIFDAGGSGANHWYHVVIREGRNREVRRLWESQDITVSRLIRVRFGPVSLPRDLKPGKYREMDKQEVSRFLNQIRH